MAEPYAHKPQLWSTGNGRFAIHEASGEHGQILYRGHTVAEIPGIPVALAIEKAYARIEKLMSSGADLDPTRLRLQRACLNLFVRGALRFRPEPQAFIVSAARSVWTTGHPLLEAIALKANCSPGTSWPAEMTDALFDDRYFAKAIPHYPAEELRCLRVEREWLKQRRVPVPYYFARFGVPTAATHWNEWVEKAPSEGLNLRARKPSSQEGHAIAVLRQGLQLIGPDLFELTSRRKLAYRVLDSHVIAGRFQSRRHNRHPQVQLSRQLFDCSFGIAMAIFVHEHAHICGVDGSSELTDELTWMLEAILEHCHDLDHLEREWTLLQECTLTRSSPRLSSEQGSNVPGSCHKGSSQGGRMKSKRL